MPEEFETGRLPEARFVRQLDRLEMGLQASIYRRQGLAELDEFFVSARKALQEPALQELLEEAATQTPSEAGKIKPKSPFCVDPSGG